MANLTQYYPAFKQVGLVKVGGKCCDLICQEQCGECKGCPVQEAIDELHRREQMNEVKDHDNR